MINKNNITCRWKNCISAMLLQSDINKLRLSQLSKLDKVYLKSASIILLQGPKNDFIEYKNEIFPNDSHIHLRACYSSSFIFPSPINVSKIPKRNFILNCCSDCSRMNAPYLEWSEKLDCFFPASLHKIKFLIYQNIYKCLIHGLRPFKYKNTCELYYNIIKKYKRERIMLNICVVLHDKVIYVSLKNHITAIGKLSFHLFLVRILG